MKIEVVVTTDTAVLPIVRVDGKPLGDDNDTAAAFHLVRAAALAAAKAGLRLNLSDADVLVASLASGTKVSTASVQLALEAVTDIRRSKAADKRKSMTVIRGGVQ